MGLRRRENVGDLSVERVTFEFLGVMRIHSRINRSRLVMFTYQSFTPICWTNLPPACALLFGKKNAPILVISADCKREIAYFVPQHHRRNNNPNQDFLAQDLRPGSSSRQPKP